MLLLLLLLLLRNTVRLVLFLMVLLSSGHSLCIIIGTTDELAPSRILAKTWSLPVKICCVCMFCLSLLSVLLLFLLQQAYSSRVLHN